jgi:hypothetical protein
MRTSSVTTITSSIPLHDDILAFSGTVTRVSGATDVSHHIFLLLTKLPLLERQESNEREKAGA